METGVLRRNLFKLRIENLELGIDKLLSRRDIILVVNTDKTRICSVGTACEHIIKIDDFNGNHIS